MHTSFSEGCDITDSAFSRMIACKRLMNRKEMVDSVLNTDAANLYGFGFYCSVCLVCVCVCVCVCGV